MDFIYGADVGRYRRDENYSNRAHVMADAYAIEYSPSPRNLYRYWLLFRRVLPSGS